MVYFSYYRVVSFVKMMDRTDIYLYGGAIVAGALVIFLGFKLFKKKGANAPKNQVANKINDFYETQDR